MMCKSCDALMGDYKYRVSLLKNAVRDFAGTIGADSTRAAAEVERLRRECHEADERLMAHWHQDHPDFKKSRRESPSPRRREQEEQGWERRDVVSKGGSA
jgi:hypothetical protein